MVVTETELGSDEELVALTGGSDCGRKDSKHSFKKNCQEQIRMKFKFGTCSPCAQEFQSLTNVLSGSVLQLRRNCR